ncbi:carotenoid cleavage dioxygenase [Erythrobacter litoralis]|uniref:Dioxygenase n=1 Tax=Erythrobacter litoralis TaxID=39960 RepID=A0A074NMV9_9SPHN|nr:carotenoid oxygenase family protein [Erythrobacter litoralis]AOL24115.1 carotenoid cleavage dioxygenase [Erythrobacter litoralis]KEO99122.1 apocarotenoid-15,15'-oxygenase [Erythrobacter litoralis]
MEITRHKPVRASLKPSNHPYLSGPWTPCHEEVDVPELEVIEGEIPADMDGIYLRNTENPVHQPLGRHHPFDGDAMIHAVSISGGRASYRNRFVRTHCFEAEQIAGGSLWGGLMDPPGTSLRPGYGAHGGLKDTGSTDIVVHAGIAYATFYQCGEAWMVDPVTLETLGKAPWGPLDGVSAHPKVDEETGELMFFNYGKHPPFMHYGVVDRSGRLVHYVPVPLAGPRLPHDMAITKNWSILNDMPLFWDEKLLERGIHAARLHEGVPTRFALIPRHGEPEDIRWFEAAPTYVLHWTNAYEDGDEVVLEGYFQDKPMPDPLEEAGEYSHMMAYVDEHSFQSRLHRWRFNLATGETREERLSDRIVEFGMINPAFAMRPSRYVWSTTTRPGWFLFNGFVRHDTRTGEEDVYRLPEGVYASESPIVPKKGATREDEAYLVTFLIDENSGSSHCAILDAGDIAKGPICRMALPHKISSGVHSTWVEHDQLDRAAQWRRTALA